MNPSTGRSSLSPADIRAAAETHHELGPDYRDAVVESFLERVGKEIDARVDSRVAAIKKQKPPAPKSPALAITSVAVGVPMTILALTVPNTGQLLDLAVIWLAIVLVNITYVLSNIQRRDR